MINEIGVVIGYIGLAATALATVIAGIRALIKGPKEDKNLETEIQERIATLAERWLKVADERLTATEAEAREAKVRADELAGRVEELEHSLQSAMSTIEILWTWGLAGGGEPHPKIPGWIFERLHQDA